MSTTLNLTEKGIAISGYDPVSYFTDHPTVGNPAISAKYGDATYYFISGENRSTFEANPVEYIPQYGGYCAVATSEGKLVPSDPENYKITDDKLYLFYKGDLGDTKPQWDADEDTLRSKADAHWAKGDLIPL